MPTLQMSKTELVLPKPWTHYQLLSYHECIFLHISWQVLSNYWPEITRTCIVMFWEQFPTFQVTLGSHNKISQDQINGVALGCTAHLDTVLEKPRTILAVCTQKILCSFGTAQNNQDCFIMSSSDNSCCMLYIPHLLWHHLHVAFVCRVLASFLALCKNLDIDSECAALALMYGYAATYAPRP